jgi:hypothetical protein
MKMVNWSDKLLDRVETALDHSGWLGKTADAALAWFLPHNMAQASCIPCFCEDCSINWGLWCLDEEWNCKPVGGPCPNNTPC